jgi:23S rRNA pseudouridine2605 synthase
MTDKRKSKRPAPRPAAAAPKSPAPEGDRIAKVMARAGLCSRRDAERWIEEGRVSVNGKVLESPAFNVTSADKIAVDGRPIGPRERTRLFLFHKPRGTVTTDRDPEGRPTVFDVLPEDLPRVVTIGRLDINTEGLLLLTNDGGLARVLELPATGWLRRYRVRAHGEVNQAQLDALAKGVVIEGVEYRGVEAHLDRVQGANVWLTMGLREGKNREIKRVLEHLGLSVNRLIRLSFGPFQLGDLPEGEVEEVKTRILQDQLGEALAQEAGVDFDAPVLDAKTREKMARHFRDDADDEPAPERPERDWRDAPKAKRKHVSVLRAERRAAGEERRKIERSETADRRGRAVKVERVATRAPEPKLESRNGRRFAAQRRDAEGGERPPMRRARPQREDARQDARFDRREERGGERPPRRPRAEAGARAPQDGGRQERRPARAARPEGERFEGKRFEGERPEGKRFDGERPARKRFDGERPQGERAPRKRFEGETYAARSSARPGPKRDGARRFERTEGAPEGRAPRREGAGKSFAGKSFGDKPARGKSFDARPPRGASSGKSFGDKPARGKSFGDKPGGRAGGGRPGGGKPSGGRSGGGGGRSGGRPGGRSGGGGRPGGGGRRGRE